MFIKMQPEALKQKDIEIEQLRYELERLQDETRRKEEAYSETRAYERKLIDENEYLKVENERLNYDVRAMEQEMCNLVRSAGGNHSSHEKTKQGRGLIQDLKDEALITEERAREAERKLEVVGKDYRSSIDKLTQELKMAQRGLHPTQLDPLSHTDTWSEQGGTGSLQNEQQQLKGEIRELRAQLEAEQRNVERLREHCQKVSKELCQTKDKLMAIEVSQLCVSFMHILNTK